MGAQHNLTGDGLFRIFAGDNSIGCSVARADTAGALSDGSKVYSATDIYNKFENQEAGNASYISNPYISGHTLTWIKQGKLVWVSGHISISGIPTGNTCFFFAGGLPGSRGKKLLGHATCLSGAPNSSGQYDSINIYIEGNQLSAYTGSGGGVPTYSGLYSFSATYIIE